MEPYEECLGRVKSVANALDRRRPLGDSVVEIDANTFEEDGTPWARCEINVTSWLGIHRDDDRFAILTLFADDEGWQIEMRIEDDVVELPPSPQFSPDAGPDEVADYIEDVLRFTDRSVRFG